MASLGREWSHVKGNASKIDSFNDSNINLANLVTSHFTHVPKRHFRGHQENAHRALSSPDYLLSALLIRLILVCFSLLLYNLFQTHFFFFFFQILLRYHWHCYIQLSAVNSWSSLFKGPVSGETRISFSFHLFGDFICDTLYLHSLPPHLKPSYVLILPNPSLEFDFFFFPIYNPSPISVPFFVYIQN